MAVLGNYVRLEPGVEKEMHFSDYYYTRKELRDPVTMRMKMVNVLVFKVDEEDGHKVEKEFSVTSEKLASQLLPYLAGNLYRNYRFRIKRIGSGFATEYVVTATPIG
jgi:hypothetical protein